MASSDNRTGSPNSVPRFAIQARTSGATYVIRLLGELDLEHTDEFQAAIEEAQASDATRVVVDLDGLWFIDSTGLRALVDAARNVANRERLKFTRGTGDVAALFRLTALDQSLPFE